MSLDAATVRKVAKLARIRLEEQEVERYAHDLSAILKMVEQLSEVDDAGADAVASVTDHTLPMREDVVSDGHIATAVLANAPKAGYDCFVVPKVIDQG